MYQVLFHPSKPTETADPDLEETSDSNDKPNPNPQHIIIHIHENNRPPKDKPLFYPRPQGWQYGQSSNGQLSIYGEEHPSKQPVTVEKESRSVESEVPAVPEVSTSTEEAISSTDVPVTVSPVDEESTTIQDDDDEIYLENLDLFEDETETDANNSTKDE